MTDPTAGAAGSSDRWASVARGADYGRRAFAWFQSITPALRSLATVLKVLAFVGMAAPVVVVGLLLAESWPPSLLSVILLLVLYGVLAWAPFGLYGFTGSLDALADLPDVLAGSPDLYRQHAEEINRLYHDAGDPATGRARGIGRGMFGGAKLIWRIRKDVPDVEGVVSLGRLSLFLVAIGGVAMTFFNLVLIPLVAGGVAFHQ